jgi:hypothetical protein
MHPIYLRFVFLLCPHAITLYNNILNYAARGTKLSDEISFIEVEPKEPCIYCGRKKLKKADKFYKVFSGDKDTNIVVCEFCKGGFSTSLLEGIEKSYVTHLNFYLKRSLLELEGTLPKELFDELDSAIKTYEVGDFSSSYRNIGLIAEWVTDKMFIRKYGASHEKGALRWEAKLGKLLADSKGNEKNPEEALLHQLSSLKWFRNIVSHPCVFEMSGEDVRLGLVSIIYALQQVWKYGLI